MLVIDDAEETRLRLCALLREEAGAEAEGCAGTASEVQDVLSWFLPECIVIDPPARGGFGLLDALSFEGAIPPLLVVLTNDSSQEMGLRSQKAGAQQVLSKAYDFERVVALVRELGGHS